MRIAALLLLLLACASARPAGAQPAYRALLVRAQAGDTTVDFTALRKAWSASPEYAPCGSDADEHADNMTVALERRLGPRRPRGRRGARTIVRVPGSCDQRSES